MEIRLGPRFQHVFRNENRQWCPPWSVLTWSTWNSSDDRHRILNQIDSWAGNQEPLLHTWRDMSKCFLNLGSYQFRPFLRYLPFLLLPWFNPSGFPVFPRSLRFGKLCPASIPFSYFTQCPSRSGRPGMREMLIISRFSWNWVWNSLAIRQFFPGHTSPDEVDMLLNSTSIRKDPHQYQQLLYPVTWSLLHLFVAETLQVWRDSSGLIYIFRSR